MTDEKYPIDVFGEVNLLEIQAEAISAAAEQHLNNSANWISIHGMNAENYHNGITKRIPGTVKSGWYCIIKTDLFGNVVYAYIGSSDYDLKSRIVKFFRHIFNKSTDGDRKLRHTIEYSNKFGNDVTNLFVCCYECPDVFKKELSEQQIRKIEGDLISSFKSRYNIAVVNKVLTPTTNKMSEFKKRSRRQESSTLDFVFEAKEKN